MKRHNSFLHSISGFSLLLIVSFHAVTLGQEKTDTTISEDDITFFEEKIRPVLTAHCYKCHSSDAENLKGGLLLDTLSSIRKGGDSGSAVVPGNINDSLIISAIQYETFEMPPSGKLPQEVIDNFIKWIEIGAPDPRDGVSDTVSSIDFEKGRDHWSYQPIAFPRIPVVKQVNWPTSEVDYFTLAKMESLKLQPVKPAGKHELIRRASFDLTGLPPKPEAVESFIQDDSPNAFSKVVENLLLSKHYGERWGRYWLDVARYAEDQAHTFQVQPNTSGYRYRDWVVSAFNTDMPYDTFVKLQIAGDLIGPETKTSYDHLVALGFFGLGAQYYKNTDAAQAAADELDDRVDTLTRGFLGLTVSCARCHDHKFDPIPTQDYYSLAGIFSSSRLHNAPLCTAEEVEAYNSGQEQVKKRKEAIEQFFIKQQILFSESKVSEIARYIQAVWKYRLTMADAKETIQTDAFAKTVDLNPLLLDRWIQFLDVANKEKLPPLKAWFELKPSNRSSGKNDSEIPDNVTSIATNFQKLLEKLLAAKNGNGTINLAETIQPDSRKPGSPLFVTPLVTKSRPTAAIDIEIGQSTSLILVVSDGGNGKNCDHADWLEPRLIGPQGELKLTELKWKSLEGYGGGSIDTNYQGKPIHVGGKSYSNGIGVHAPSIITYEIPEGYTHFKATGGLDNSGTDQKECGDQARVQFSVYTETPIERPSAPPNDLLPLVLGKDGPFALSDQELEKGFGNEVETLLTKLKSELETTQKNVPAMYPIAHSYTEATVADMKVFVRGNPANQKEIAPRRFLKVLAGDNPSLFQNGSGRQELAEAIANDRNPLTARVMVNRIWQHHFGRGIVDTPSNFGKQGELPTHPKLLDYLAARFIESGWSIKALHRIIMLTSTYQLSTHSTDANMEIDADNRFLWKVSRRRLDVEAWRDALLDVSGKLDAVLGGPSMELTDANNVRRTLYAKISRHQLDSLLRLFDFPDANITSAKRSETTVPQQQLFVLNSPFMIEQAKSLSARLHKEVPRGNEARIKRAFLLAYGRPASTTEIELGISYLETKDAELNKLTRWERYAQVLLGSNEFMYLD